VRPARVAFGVAAGLVAGRVASLAQTGTGELGGVTFPPMLVVMALAGLGATVLAAGLGELWADAAPALRHSRSSWTVALVGSSVVFAIVLWAASSLELALDRLGWMVVRLWLVTVLGSWPTLVAVAVLAAVAAVALHASRQGAMAPAWLLERGESWPWPTAGRPGLAEAVVPAVAGGLAGAGAIIGFRVLAGPPASDTAGLQRFYTYVWVAAAAAGGAVTLALGLLVPRRGVGVGALAGPLASLVAVAGLLAMTSVLGGSLDADFVTPTVRFPLALGLLLAVLVAPAGLLAWHRERRLARVWPAAAALGLVAVLAVVGGRDALTGNQSILVPDIGDREQALALVEVTQYAATATDVERRYSAVEAAVAAIVADQTADGPTRAAPASVPRSWRPCRRCSATRRRTSRQPPTSDRSTLLV